MTNNELDLNTTEQVDPSSDITTVGAVLRQAREGKGLSIQEVALQLHLRPSVILDLENDKFDAMSSATYVRGYVKNYARFVAADIELIKTCLTQQLPQEAPPSMQSFSRKTTKQARDKRLQWFTFFIIFSLLALLVLWWVQKSTLLNDVDVSQPSMEEVAATEQERALEAFELSQRAQPLSDLPLVTSDADAATESETELNKGTESDLDTNTAALAGGTSTAQDSLAQNGLALNGLAQNQNQASVMPEAAIASSPARVTALVENRANSVSNNEAQAQPRVSAVEQSGAASLAEGDKLSVELTGDSWMKVVDSTGKVLIDGVKTPGRTIAVSGKAPFSLILGAPKFVSLSFNGEQVDLSQYLDGRVARFTIPEA
jgi:cytoskeleton protein RodZ